MACVFQCVCVSSNIHPKMANTMSLMYALPYELTCDVARWLSPNDLRTFALVNKQARMLAYDPNVFRSVVVHSVEQLAAVKYNSIQVLEVNCESMDGAQLTKLVNDIVNGPYASTIVHLKLYVSLHYTSGFASETILSCQPEIYTLFPSLFCRGW